VVGLSLSLRLEAAELGVKISCACPGFVRTNAYRNTVSVNPNRPPGVPLEQLAGALASGCCACGISPGAAGTCEQRAGEEGGG
jgi:NAD(P)-dependent dehydrogenase (short-subunit alcohol dehydrogenase family)